MSMAVELGSWVEITVPAARMQGVSFEVDEAIEAVGGATFTEGRGYYKRTDGTLDYEEVNIIRFEFNRANYPQYSRKLRAIVDQLLKLGEESVLWRSFDSLGPNRCNYESELIFK